MADSSTEAVLSPSITTIGVCSPDTFVKAQTTFTIKAKSWHNSELDVYNSLGGLMFICIEETQHVKKCIKDVAGTTIFDINRGVLDKFKATFGDGRPAFEIETKSIVAGGHNMSISFNNHDNTPQTLFLKGSWLDRYIEITHQDKPIARIRHHPFHTLRKGNKYEVDIAGGVDAALIIAILICLDEGRQPSGGGGD